MSYTFGKPKPEPVQTIVGEKDGKAIYIPVEAKIRFLVHVPEAILAEKTNEEITSAYWEKALREAAANAVLGTVAEGYDIAVVALTELEPSHA
jgi:hypothetical protein